ncbi:MULTISPECIES: terminase [Pseudomonadaceae]|uniref:terminase n=1 Tax=Pseudomonadaceae TaxID=135621 RepID=UPI0015E10AD2|nr:MULTISPECIES: terminase [Pseudomonadaceae]MCQ4325771.1 terminase [Stutzerimonas stutzeri]UIP88218.1 terminase [Pseudomonas phenolilytica]
MSVQAFERRLATLEAAKASAGTGDLRQQILHARTVGPAPTHTRDELQELAEGDNATGRIARGWLRIGYVLPGRPRGEQTPAIDPATALPAMAGYLYDKPLEFVLFAYDWTRDRSLAVVELPERWRLIYDSEHGPDAWACELLEHLGDSVRARGFDGRNAVDAIREAISSGHGIGKSAITAWLVNWIMSTRPNARGVVTANTAPQLESKTWAEIGKWTKRSVFCAWFDVTTGKGSMRMTAKGFAESWRCDAQTCREENSESFAGLHAADSTAFYVLDEASAIPAAIWEVLEGGLTDGEPHVYAFGNPTRNSGRFFEAFNGQRHRWHSRQIDSRSCQITNKNQIQEWIDDYGIGSDFVKVRVLGQFPSASSLQFIGRELVNDAQVREVEIERFQPVILGVDPARFGGDASVIWTRQGRNARDIPPIRLQGVDTMTLAARVAEHANFLRGAGHSVIINVDGGGVGGGVIDRLRSVGFDVNEVQFGSRALDPRRWANRRAEIWGLMREWLAGGAIPRDEGLATDLCAVEYGYNAADAILLEKKESMKARGLASPDSADALAVTFAVPVALTVPGQEHLERNDQRREYNPYASTPRGDKRRGYDPLGALGRR